MYKHVLTDLNNRFSIYVLNVKQVLNKTTKIKIYIKYKLQLNKWNISGGDKVDDSCYTIRVYIKIQAEKGA